MNAQNITKKKSEKSPSIRALRPRCQSGSSAEALLRALPNAR